jgi:NADPH:quinone reductase-like Zn-dependent oxidoreductase
MGEGAATVSARSAEGEGGAGSGGLHPRDQLLDGDFVAGQGITGGAGVDVAYDAVGRTFHHSIA